MSHQWAGVNKTCDSNFESKTRPDQARPHFLRH